MNKLHIFTNAFNTHSCLHSPPTNFEWIFNKYPENNEPVVYFDDFIFNYVNDGYTGLKYGWLGESSEIINSLIFAITNNLNSFKKSYRKIYTNDRRLIEKDPDFFAYNPPASNKPWIEKPSFYEKKHLCSFITSFKSFTSGHVKRLMTFRDVQSNPMFKGHLYGRDYNPLENKIDGLKDYMFSVAMENAVYPKYYTEKVTDCFATATVPVYYGDKSICEDFDNDGIIFLDDLKSFDELTPERYINMLPAVRRNYDKVLQLKSSDDFLYENVTNDKIECK